MATRSVPVELTGQFSADGDALALRVAPDVAATDARPIPRGGRRGWLIRRLLVAADLAGLTLAFLLTDLILGVHQGYGDVSSALELVAFVAALPIWIVAAKLYGLYDRDEERTDHSTIDELAGVFHVVSVGVWLVFAVAWLTTVFAPDPTRLLLFWGSAIALVTVARVGARAIARRTEAFKQVAVIVGGGDVGQLVARKLLQHPEYGITLIGIVDDAPKQRRDDIGELPLLGPPRDVRNIVRRFGVDRVIFAFSNAPDRETLSLIRALDDQDVQIDLVPRLFDVVGPRASLHSVEGLPLIGLSPVRLSRSSRMCKRATDVVGAAGGLVLTAPLFAYASWRISRESPGPVFFKQRRVGLNGQEFTLFKFRTMELAADDGAHRDYIKRIMDSKAAPEQNGLYKLDRPGLVFRFGRWLRKTSLDELPQLINVLRGEMSLVGPRPCLRYETEHFADHHFERFAVRPGMTGLWQVTARAHSTFAEALDMDVAYVRGWSLGLDLTLLFRTPLQLVRGRATA